MNAQQYLASLIASQEAGITVQLVEMRYLLLLMAREAIANQRETVT